MPFDPIVYETDESLTVSHSPWLRLASILPCLYFFCMALFVLAAPVCAMTDGNNLLGWCLCIVIAAILFFPTWVFWQAVKPYEIEIYFDEGCYEIRRGFGHFRHCTRGRFSDISRLIVWNKCVTRVDVCYQTSLIWKTRRFPFTERLRVVYNDPSDIIDWSVRIAEKLNVPSENNIKNWK